MSTLFVNFQAVVAAQTHADGLCQLQMFEEIVCVCVCIWFSILSGESGSRYWVFTKNTHFEEIARVKFRVGFWPNPSLIGISKKSQAGIVNDIHLPTYTQWKLKSLQSGISFHFFLIYVCNFKSPKSWRLLETTFLLSFFLSSFSLLPI